MRYISHPTLKTDGIITNNNKTYRWKVTQSPALTKEPMSPPLTSLFKWVKVAPNEFEFDNTKGNLKSWLSLAEWISNLNLNGDDLSPSMITKVKNLTANSNTDLEKIRILYHFLQKNTRYVSIQLGIGGFKPMLASKVSELNYGDCIALSNYMKAMLKAVNIPSH